MGTPIRYSALPGVRFLPAIYFWCAAENDLQLHASHCHGKFSVTSTYHVSEGSLKASNHVHAWKALTRLNSFFAIAR